MISSSLYEGKSVSFGKFTLLGCESLSVTLFPSLSTSLVISAIFVNFLFAIVFDFTFTAIFTSLYCNVFPSNAFIKLFLSDVSFSLDKYPVFTVLPSSLTVHS